jgi:hypothetical protein
MSGDSSRAEHLAVVVDLDRRRRLRAATRARTAPARDAAGVVVPLLRASGIRGRSRRGRRKGRL